MAGWLIANGCISSVTVASPDASRARIALRVGSAKAAKVLSSLSWLNITRLLYNNIDINLSNQFLTIESNPHVCIVALYGQVAILLSTDEDRACSLSSCLNDGVCNQFVGHHIDTQSSMNDFSLASA